MRMVASFAVAERDREFDDGEREVVNLVASSGDPVGIAGYLGSGDRFDRALATFAEAYADQNERDYAALRRAVDDDRVTAQSDGAITSSG